MAEIYTTNFNEGGNNKWIIEAVLKARMFENFAMRRYGRGCTERRLLRPRKWQAWPELSPSILSFESLGVGVEWALTDICGRDGDACSFVRRRLLECKASEAIKSFVCLLECFEGNASPLLTLFRHSHFAKRFTCPRGVHVNRQQALLKVNNVTNLITQT